MRIASRQNLNPTASARFPEIDIQQTKIPGQSRLTGAKFATWPDQRQSHYSSTTRRRHSTGGTGDGAGRTTAGTKSPASIGSDRASFIEG